LFYTLNASAQETEYFFSKKLKVALKAQEFGIVSETAMLEMEEKSEVVIMNPSVILSVSKNENITSYSNGVTKKLKKVLEAL
jgi:hypothetical protein